MEDSRWYSVRRLFNHGSSDKVAGGWIYEERIILVEAPDFDEAIERSTSEAREYELAVRTCQDMGFAQVYELSDEATGDLSEVFSLIRDSDLAPEAYIGRYFADGNERGSTMEDAEDE